MKRELIGIVWGADKKSRAAAVPTSSIIDLLQTLEDIQIFSIYNNTEFSMFYEVQWEKDGAWKEEVVLPKKEEIHAMPYDKNSFVNPKIRFKNIQNGEAPSESVQALKNKFRKFGKGITDVKAHIEIDDAFRYQFEFNSKTKKISLEESKFVQAFAIHNPTKLPIFFQYRWHEDAEWREGYIEPSVGWRFVQESEKVSASYPRIRFDESKGVKRKYPEKSWVLETQTERSSKSIKIRDDLNNSNPRRHHFRYDSKNKKLSLSQGFVSERGTTVWPFLLFVVLIVVLIIQVTELFFPKRHIFSIKNNTQTTVDYHTKWTKKGDWKLNSLEPGKLGTHSRTGFFKRKPQFRFKQIANDKDPIINNKGQIVNNKKKTKDVLKIEQTDKAVIVGTVKETQVELKTKTRRIIQNTFAAKILSSVWQKLEGKIKYIRQNTRTKISQEDARKYHFGYDPETNELTLYDSEKK